MSKEFQDRLARGELTNTDDYRRMKEALADEKARDTSKPAVAEKSVDSQEWKNWDLSPVWSPADADKKATTSNSIKADSVQRALDLMDKL